jgi:glucokinase
MGIANVVSLINPEVVILGGGVGSNASDWLSVIESTLRKYAQPISAQLVKITVSTLGNKAGLLGAAYSLYLRLYQENRRLERR